MNGTVYHILKKLQELPNINTKITAENLISPLSLGNSCTSPIFFVSFTLKEKKR